MAQGTTMMTDGTQAKGSLITYTAIGTVIQVAMVVIGHFNEFVKTNVFAIGGMGISLLAGLLFARAAAQCTGSAIKGGAIVGGVCAVLGVGVSMLLRDTEAMVLVIAAASSSITGLIGGLIGYKISGRIKV